MENCCSGCGCNSSSCCSDRPASKEIVIDFLYLDLSVCERCQGTDKNLDEAISEVSSVLKAAGYGIKLNKVNIVSRELAIKYEFESSPTIRVNGYDIACEVKESSCTECGDLCGDSVDCRVWSYEGIDYTNAPKEMIVNAILKEVYSDTHAPCKKEGYKLPKNLEAFFNGLEDKK